MKAAWTAVVLVVVAHCTGCSAEQSGPKALKMGMMPKLVGIPYFEACKEGAEEAAAELGIELDYDGPATDSVEEQAKIVDRWIVQGYDIIAVAPNDPEVIAPALRRAADAGIVVITWDADANPTESGRQKFVNQATFEGIGNALVDVLAEAMDEKGKAVIISGSVTSPNQQAWMEVMNARLKDRYPDIEVPATLYSDEDQAKAQQLARDAMSNHPDLTGIWGITSVALPGAAKAVRDAGRSGEILVTGLSLPSTTREYVKDGTVPKFVLWNPVDLGYLTVYVGKQLAEAKLENGTHTLGRLESIEVSDDEVLLGEPLIFDSENIDAYNF